MRKGLLVAGIAVGCLLLWKTFGGNDEASTGRVLRLATTTSVKDSGLLGALLPAFTQKTGYHVEVSAVGSGRAMEQLRQGKADVAVTHAPADELAALAAGQIARRTPFMHNEFVLVGPKDAALTIAGAGDVKDALRLIAKSGRSFVSRGDDSGTHRRERDLWRLAGVSPTAPFVISAGTGMKGTLTRASKEGAFTLTDRATFLAARKELDLAIVFQGDDELRNTYSVLELADHEGARAFAELVRSAQGRAVIGAYGVESLGEPLFTPEE
jgi:tungstate transport system substrate-binding protein